MIMHPELLRAVAAEHHSDMLRGAEDWRRTRRPRIRVARQRTSWPVPVPRWRRLAGGIT